ncbi:MAG: SpoIIE family protein phosphatase [bacterium]|nr:SpoIIE family protein phosphatase [bacterium]
MRKILAVLCFILMLSAALYADVQHPQNGKKALVHETGASSHGDGTLHFKQLSIDEGLSQNSVSCIMQDSRGFMWFGTQDGLNKYDGYNFAVYKPQPGTPNSLSHNQVNVIYEDDSGMIWIGTEGGGLNRFDPFTETFYRYPVDPKDPTNFNIGFIRAICQDSTGDLWVGTYGGGITRITRTIETSGNGREKRKETFEQYKVMEGRRPGMITSIIEDHNKVVWIGTQVVGLFLYHRATNKFIQFRNSSKDPHSLSSNWVSTLYEARGGTLWVGTLGGGLNRLDKKTGKFSRYQINSKPGPEDVTSICEDRSGVLWVGTRDGLHRFDKRSDRFSCYRRNINDPYSLKSNSILSLYEDRSRVLWIGTELGGVSKFDRADKFIHYKADRENPNGLSDNFIYALGEDKRGDLWIGTEEHGLDRFNRKKGTVKHYRAEPGNTKRLQSNTVSTIYPDREGRLWIGTNGGGLARFNYATESFATYMSERNNRNSLSRDVVLCIFQDLAGTLWLGTDSGGLNKFYPETESFEWFLPEAGNPNSLSDNTVTVIYEDPDAPGILWLGTMNGGLTRFDTTQNSFLQIEADADAGDQLSNSCIQAICKDLSGTLWIGTYGGGLNEMIREKGRPTCFRIYTEDDGLANNSIYGILADDNGLLWISTNKGISKFDPRNTTFKNYNVQDGLQGNEFNSGAYYKSQDGELFFGGLNGFNAFYPHMVKDNPHVPPVVITGFKLSNTPVAVGPRSLLPKPILLTDEVTLPYSRNVFTFQFAALDYTIPEKNRYAYKMENFDKDWIYTDANRRFASYSNLQPGAYTFRVKGSNNDGIWNHEGARIRVIIAPPYWATWWFRVAVMLMAFLLAIVFYRRRLKNVRIKTELQAAHDAQMSIMPQSDPQLEGFDISGVCVPAHEVGGDFFDYIWLDAERNKLGIAVGDVSGKAMKSAMTAVMTSGMIFMEADDSCSVKDIMTHVNRPLYFKTDKKVFTALCLACLDLQTKEITFTNAGLNDPLIKRGTKVSALKSCGAKLPLGVKEECKYQENKHQLKSDDVLVFFTDGITESQNNGSEFYGLEALQALLEKNDLSELTAREIKEYVIADAVGFAAGAPQHDDMTVVVVKIL